MLKAVAVMTPYAKGGWWLCRLGGLRSNCSENINQVPSVCVCVCASLSLLKAQSHLSFKEQV